MLSVHINKEQSTSLDFTEVDLCFRSIKVINNIPITIKFISRLYLDGNYLMSLNGIEQFYNLQVFHFNYNLISLPKQINRIHNPFFLREICFIANPIYYSKTINLETLRSQGFRRLQKINVFQSVYQSPQKNTNKIKQINQPDQSIPNQNFTVRRVASYKHSPQHTQTNRKFVGKIYSNPKWTERNKQRPPFHSKQTKQSTDKQNIDQSGIVAKPISQQRDEDQQQIKPFQHSIEQSDQTAKFSGQVERLGYQFLSQEKERLADTYYKRCILQKYFKLLRSSYRYVSVQEQMEPYQGQILNNNLQTLHFSLIKLKHKFTHRT